jgi:hypothetical protein
MLWGGEGRHRSARSAGGESLVHRHAFEDPWPIVHEQQSAAGMTYLGKCGVVCDKERERDCPVVQQGKEAKGRRGARKLLEQSRTKNKNQLTDSRHAKDVSRAKKKCGGT